MFAPPWMEEGICLVAFSFALDRVSFCYTSAVVFVSVFRTEEKVSCLVTLTFALYGEVVCTFWGKIVFFWMGTLIPGNTDLRVLRGRCFCHDLGEEAPRDALAELGCANFEMHIWRHRHPTSKGGASFERNLWRNCFRLFRFCNIF